MVRWSRTIAGGLILAFGLLGLAPAALAGDVLVFAAASLQNALDADYTLAQGASAAGCLFTLDSDAHTTAQLAYAETAIAHARLAGIPAERIVNCWPLDRLLSWLSDPASERRDARTEYLSLHHA